MAEAARFLLFQLMVTRSAFGLAIAALLAFSAACPEIRAQSGESALDRLLKELETNDPTDSELEMLLNDPAFAEVAELAVELEETGPGPKWQPIVTLEVGGGYKDNILLSPLLPEGSLLTRSALDLIVLRDANDGLEAFVFGSWEQIRFEKSEADDEVTAILTADVKKETESGWDLSLNAQYIYTDQVVDLSDDPLLPISLRIQGHAASTTIRARRYLPKRYWAELGMEVSRSDFIPPLDDYWAYLPRAEVAKWWGQNHLAFSYVFMARPYDTREEADAIGFAVAGTGLQYDTHRLEFQWRQKWGKDSAWKTRTRLRRELRFDNGSGFYNSRGWRIDQKIRYRRGKWSVAGEVALSYKSYPNQFPIAPLQGVRDRLDWNFRCRVDREISRHWKGYIAFDHETSESNERNASYSVNFVHAGLVFER